MQSDLDEDARRLVERVDVVRRPSDLDLLIFFARHPRTLLASEQLAAFLGYGANEIDASLDTLVGARLITRTATPLLAARLYELPVDHPTRGGWLPALLQLASTREGRLALLRALRRARERDNA